MKNIIVLQHIKIEDPGYIKDLMLKDKVHIKTVELDEGEKIVNINKKTLKNIVKQVLNEKNKSSNC